MKKEQKKQRKELEERLAEQNSEINITRAQAALARANNRIRVKEEYGKN